jgi:hypothetical protein
MGIRRLGNILLVALACVALLPAGAAAQSQFSGSVTDNTGGVLPGVTVEATSPVLIEGARVAVTDGQGQFTIINLRPGTFTVSFTLVGFSTQIREGVILPADTTISLNIEMAIGAVAENITVSGESPVVDIQRVQRTEVITRELLEAIPTGRSVYSFAALVPGIQTGEGFGGNRQDIAGTRSTNQQYIQGGGQSSIETGVFLEGLDVNSMSNDGATKQYMNPMQAAETTFTTSGMGADTGQSGIRINIIPRDGGNTLSGQGFLGGTSRGMTWENFNPRMGAMGIRGPSGGDYGSGQTEALETGTPKIHKIYDANVAVGGPIVRDKLWFYTSYRDWGSDNIELNTLNRDGTPALDDSRMNSILARITYQANTRNKFASSFDRIFKRRPHQFGPNTDRDTASRTTEPNINYYTATAKWTSTVSSRSLLELGWSAIGQALRSNNQPGIDQPTPSQFFQCISTPCAPSGPAEIAAQGVGGDPWFHILSRNDERLTSLRYESAGARTISLPYRQNLQGSYSYVTGSHNIKAGFINRFGKQTVGTVVNGDISNVNYFDEPNPWGHSLPWLTASHPNSSCDASGLNCGLIGRPQYVTVRSTPASNERRVDFDYGIYIQDSWTLDRLTLNLGIRAEGGRISSPGQNKQDGRFSLANDYAPLSGDFFPKIGPDWSPRFSAAYDVFGDGKTALKTSWNRYYGTFGFTWLMNLDAYAPAEVRSDSRDWYDVTLMPGTDTPMGTAGCEISGTCTNPYGTDGDNIPQNWEIGLPGNDLFSRGSSRVICTEGLVPYGGRFTCDQDWQRRGDDVLTFALQQEVMPGVSVNFEWRRRWTREEDGTVQVHRFFDQPAGGGPQSFQDNDIWVLEDTVVAPLPYTGIIPIYGIYQGVEALSGSVDATIPENFNYRDRYTGLEVGINARLPNGGMIFGAWTAEVPGESSASGINDDCGPVLWEGDNPNSLRFCNEFNNPGNWLHEFKLSGAYPLPWGNLQLAGTLQAYPGNSNYEYWGFARNTYYPSRYARYDSQWYNETNCVAPCTVGGFYNSAPGSQSGKLLCGSIGTCKTGQYDRSTNIDYQELLPYASIKSLPYFTQLDLSIARIFNFGGTRFDTRFEGFNIFNGGTVLGAQQSLGTSYGAQGDFMLAQRVMMGRVLRVSLTARF